jgi:excisionase family DNA binding protein
MPGFFSIADATAKLSVTRQTVFNMLKDKRLDSVLIGTRCRLISASSVQRLLDARTARA